MGINERVAGAIERTADHCTKAARCLADAVAELRLAADVVQQIEEWKGAAVQLHDLANAIEGLGHNTDSLAARSRAALADARARVRYGQWRN